MSKKSQGDASSDADYVTTSDDYWNETTDEDNIPLVSIMIAKKKTKTAKTE